MDIEILDDLEVEGTERFNTYLAIATTTGAKVLHGCDRIDIYDYEGEGFKHPSHSLVPISHSANKYLNGVHNYLPKILLRVQ